MADYELGERWDIWCALPPDPETVLDVGCGSGMGLGGLVNRGITVVGVDVDPKGIAKARLRLSEARLMDVERDPWPADWLGRFDVVAFCDSLEHFADPWTVLRAAQPLLRTGGRVVISVPNLRQWRLLIKAGSRALALPRRGRDYEPRAPSLFHETNPAGSLYGIGLP